MSTATTPAPKPTAVSKEQAEAVFAKGLEGIIAGETAICSIEQGGLWYRGYEIHDLAQNATFEEVAFLLLEGHKPSASELSRFKAEVIAERPLHPAVTSFIESMGGYLASGRAVPMDILRSAISILGHTDPDCQDNSGPANLRKSKRLLAKIPTIIGHMQNVIDGKAIIGRELGGDPTIDHAANLLYLMTGQKPAKEYARVIDVSLILYAEHDYNASTFTSRVIAGTLSDMHGAVSGGVAALKGSLHGGANEMAMEMLKEIMHDVGEKGIGTKAVDDWMHKAFDTKRKLMGFGHRVYKNGDHRAPILHKLGRNIATSDAKNPGGHPAIKWFELGEQVQKIMLDKKTIHPNVDFPCGMTYFTMGIPVPQYTPIFVASRITGWAAHIIEQHANNRLIRPLSKYTGEAPRKWNG
ncbi:MAG: bifunctional 2-methylcitrate synthase/citrate synthase [Phycisphaerales bacterium]|nr:bifunctional 2-methylcitrate synthase/citrate synthase [Phycisphaerales bacterium]